MERERPYQYVRRNKRHELERARRHTLQPPGTPLGYAYIGQDLQKYEEGFFWKRGRMLTMVTEAYKRHLKEGKGDDPVRVLDFGCGQNQAMRDLYQLNKKYGPTLKVVGVSVGDPRTAEQRKYDEWDAHAITFIDRKYNDFGNSKEGASERFDLGSNVFDIIVSQVTFQHLYDPFAEMKMLYRALRPGGEMHIRVAIGFLGRKFGDGEEGNRMAMECLESARESGIDIRIVGGHIQIIKNNKRLVFPRLHYRTIDSRTPRDPNTVPIYQLDSPRRHAGRETLKRFASALRRQWRK